MWGTTSAAWEGSSSLIFTPYQIELALFGALTLYDDENKHALFMSALCLLLLISIPVHMQKKNSQLCNTYSLPLKKWLKWRQSRTNLSRGYGHVTLYHQVVYAPLAHFLPPSLQHTSAAQQEHQEKAWLRHKHALARVKLERVSSFTCVQGRIKIETKFKGRKYNNLCC